MSEPAEKMVLRTVYLPPSLDEKLRVHAFRSKVSKNDLMRKAIERELADVPGFGKEPAKAAAKPARKSPAKKVQAKSKDAAA